MSAYKAPGGGELTIELESRDAYSAVALALGSKECYRCLTVTSKLWHEYGSLKLPMCNGCVVLMNMNVCGWCGTDGEGKGPTAFYCSSCRRPVHEACQKKLRGNANAHEICIVCELKSRIKHRDHASHLTLIPQDLSSLLNNHIFSFSKYFQGSGPRESGKERGRENSRELSLPEISKQGAGGCKGVVGFGTASEPKKVPKSVFGSGESNEDGFETYDDAAKRIAAVMRDSSLTAQERHIKIHDIRMAGRAARPGAKSSMALTREAGEGDRNMGEGVTVDTREGAKSATGLTHLIGGKGSPSSLASSLIQSPDREQWKGRKARWGGKEDEGVAFDKLLLMTASNDVIVREQSRALDMQREFRARWNKLTAKSIVLETAAENDIPTMKSKKSRIGTLKHDGLSGSTPLASHSSSLSRSHSPLKHTRHKDLQREFMLADCLERVRPVLADVALCYFTRPFRDDKGCTSTSTRFLTPNQVYFIFAEDFGIVPCILSRSECRVITYQTIGSNPEFAEAFLYICQHRETVKQENMRIEPLESVQHSVLENSGVKSRGAMTADAQEDGTHEAQEHAAHEAYTRAALCLGQALLAFMQQVADFGKPAFRDGDESVEPLSPPSTAASNTNSPSKRKSNSPDKLRRTQSNEKWRKNQRMPLSMLELIQDITHLDNAELVSERLAKYPTQEQLDQKLRDEETLAERQRIAKEIQEGKRVPYRLDKVGLEESEQMQIWQNCLATVFEFFSNPLDEQFVSNEAADDVLSSMGKCFQALDCDGDGLISLEDATKALTAAGCNATLAGFLADVLLFSVPIRVNEDGMTWDEFKRTLPPASVHDEELESLAECWFRLLQECRTPQEKAMRAVHIMQRQIGTVWLETNGQLRKEALEEHQDQEWFSQCVGIGAVFTFDDHGRILVCKVARPGPADGKLYGGDIIVAVNNIPLGSLGPGEAMSKLINAGGVAGDVELMIERGAGVEVEIIARTCPKLPPPLPKFVLERDPLKGADGSIGMSSVLKIFRLFGIVPTALMESEVMLLCDVVDPTYVPQRDGEMIFSFENFKTLLTVMTESDKFYQNIKRMMTSVAARRCYAQLTQHETQLGALYIAMKLPRRNVPGGLSWIKVRYGHYVVHQRHSHQHLAFHTGAFNDMLSNIEMKIMSQFRNAKELLLADGLTQYFQACKQEQVVPQKQIYLQLLHMSPILKYEGPMLKVGESLAIVAALNGNHHVQSLILNNAGLSDAPIKALADIFEEKGALTLHLSKLDLSRNPLGSHKALRVPRTSAGAIGDIVRIVGSSRVLTELRLCGVGLGDGDARALCSCLVATSARAMTKIDFSDNQLTDRSTKPLSTVILKYERLLYLNLTGNWFTIRASEKLLKTVQQRERKEREEKERKRQIAAESLLPEPTPAPFIFIRKTGSAYGNATISRSESASRLSRTESASSKENKEGERAPEPTKENKEDERAPEPTESHTPPDATARARFLLSTQSNRRTGLSRTIAAVTASVGTNEVSRVSTQNSNFNRMPSDESAFSRIASGKKKADSGRKKADDGPFGPRQGMYKYDRILDKNLSQTVEYLEELCTKTKWDELESSEDGKFEQKLKVLVDMRVDGNDIRTKSPDRHTSASRSPSRSKSGCGALRRSRSGRGSRGPRRDRRSTASPTPPDPFLIKEEEYLELKAVLGDVDEEALTLADRLLMLQMNLKGKKLTVLQAWEQMLPFLHSSCLYAASNFLHSRLGSQGDVEKMQALQNVYQKPRQQIFIPDDSKLSSKSATRRRTRAPVVTYLDPGSVFRHSHSDSSPDKALETTTPTSRQKETFNTDKLMATISAKLRARTVREKQGRDADTASAPLSLPKIEKGENNQEKKEKKKEKKESKDKGKSKKK